jgi:hypothetical protein
MTTAFATGTRLTDQRLPAGVALRHPERKVTLT